MNFGTLDYKRDDDEDYFVIEAEYETELMIKRLIPSHRNVPLMVRIHPENTKLVRMVMREYPLEIKTCRWNEALEQIDIRVKLSEELDTLDYIEPDASYFTGKLLPFQKQALDFLIKTDGNTLITDEMGLGKTWESLAFVATKKTFPVIVVAPLVTLTNWKREIEKLISLGNTRSDNQKLLFDGERREPIINIIREGKESQLDLADFYLINYELVAKRLKNLLAVKPMAIIYDEVHYLRSPFTKRYFACKSLASFETVKHRMGLSGTPIYNKGIEMFNICEVIKAGLLGEASEFIRRYCYHWNAEQTSDDGKSALSNLLKKSIMIRRKKIEVLEDLPDKIRMKQIIPIDTELYEVELQKLYDKIAITREQLSMMVEKDDQKEGLFELNKKIREMRIAERQIAGLAKAPHVVKYMESLLEDYEEEKFVVFCHHRSVHKALVDGLWRHNPVQVIGGQSDQERQDAIDRFQTDKRCKVIICGLRAGNLGISLTASA